MLCYAVCLCLFIYLQGSPETPLPWLMTKCHLRVLTTTNIIIIIIIAGISQSPKAVQSFKY